MAEPQKTPERYSVDDLVLDVGARTVTRAGEAVALPKLSFDLLVVLVRWAPNVATTGELMSAVWGDVIVGAPKASPSASSRATCRRGSRTSASTRSTWAR